MVRVRHGELISLSQLDEAISEVHKINARLRLASAPVRISGPTQFDYMFPKLQSDPGALLPDDKPEETVENLKKLGETMSEPGTNTEFDSVTPAAYTYFGQFVDHDITLELQSDELRDLDNPELKPLPPDVIRNEIKNRRTPTPDLDSVYGVTSDGEPVPRVCSDLVVSPVSPSPGIGPRPKGKDEHNDLPRKIRSDDHEVDREALIGDARNDENLIISQMHVAFLRAHRALVVGRGLTFNEARKTLVQHYQWLIVHDFLKRIAGKEVVDEILTYGHRFYRPHDPPCGLYIPLEFSAAAYRFGHSMVRSSYDYNDNFPAATLKQLFSITAFSGELGGYEHVPEAWIIQWEKFMDGGNRARRIDTGLVNPLSALQDTQGQPIRGTKGNLAVRNLLRGYLLRIPVGQQVAQALGLRALSAKEIERVASEVNPEQVKVLRESKFIEHTPLWYYILAESAARSPGMLGPVGRTIVAEVLIGLVRWSDDSILSRPGWEPTLGSRPGRFTLEDFFRLAGVWG
jgi:hypothetical protein